MRSPPCCLYNLAPLLLLPLAAEAESLRCNTELVSVGDLAVELQAACGAPDQVDRRTIARSEVSGADEVVNVYEEVETWIYAATPGRMMRLVEVRGGKVQEIRSIPVRAGFSAGRCERAIFGAPTTVGQVELTCGEPDDRVRWVEERVKGTGRGPKRHQLVTKERWIYLPAEGRRARVLEFQDGKLMAP